MLSSLLLFMLWFQTSPDNREVERALLSASHDWKWFEIWGGPGVTIPKPGDELTFWVYYKPSSMTMCSRELKFCASYFTSPDDDWVAGWSRKTGADGTLEELKALLRGQEALLATNSVIAVRPAPEPSKPNARQELSLTLTLEPAKNAEGTYHYVRLKMPVIVRKPVAELGRVTLNSIEAEFGTLMLESIAEIFPKEEGGVIVVPHLDWRDQEAYVGLERPSGTEVNRLVRHGPMPWNWAFGEVVRDKAQSEFLLRQIQRHQWARIPK